jgi:hypothetical protein
MHLAPATCLSAPFTFLWFGLHTPDAAALEEASSLLSLSLFFLLLDLTADGAINGDRVKHTILSQLVLALATSCKGEMLWRKRSSKEKYLELKLETCKMMAGKTF